MTNGKNKEMVWHVRVTESLDEQLENFIKMDTHNNKAEYIREAVRSKLQTDYESLERVKSMTLKEEEEKFEAEVESEN